MKSSFYPMAFFLFIMVGVQTSCKKHNDSNIPPVPVPKIKSYMVGNDVRNYFYDDKGRLIRTELSLYGNIYYDYTDTTVVQYRRDSSGAITSRLVYSIGANGLATSLRNGPNLDLYVYNKDRQLISDTYTYSDPDPSQSYFYRLDYHYSNWNLDSTCKSYDDGTTTTSVYYPEYYSDRVNTLDNANYGQPYLGAKSKNPFKKEKYRVWSSGGEGFLTYTYNYEYDTVGRIIKINQYEGSIAYPQHIITYY